MGFLSELSQFFPPKPKFTEANVPDITGKVCLVTGSNTGMGKEVARILYSKNATVYVAARDEGKGLAAIDDIKKAHPQSKGILRFLQLDLADLAAVSTSADQFLASERRLDLLFNNAGVMHPPESWKTKQGYDMMLGVNCVGHFLLTKKLTPLLQKAGADSPKGTVRIIFVSSSAATLSAPKEGVPLDNIDYKTPKDTLYRYGVSKAGNYLQATEFAKRYKNDNIISVALNPGNGRTDLGRTSNPFLARIVIPILSYPPLYTAYTEIFAAFSSEVTSGSWVIPFGRMGVQEHLSDAAKSEAEGGMGVASKFWEWQEEQVKSFL